MIKNFTLLYSLNNLNEFENFIIEPDELLNIEKDSLVSDYLNQIIKEVDERVLNDIFEYSKAMG